MPRTIASARPSAKCSAQSVPSTRSGGRSHARLPMPLADSALRSAPSTPRAIPAESGRHRDDPPGYSDRVTRLVSAGEAGNQHPESPQVQACHRGGTFAGNHSLGSSVGQLLWTALRSTRSGRRSRARMRMPDGARHSALLTSWLIPAESGRRRDDPPGYSDRFARLIGAGEAGDQHPESPQWQACHRGGTFAG